MTVPPGIIQECKSCFLLQIMGLFWRRHD